MIKYYIRIFGDKALQLLLLILPLLSFKMGFATPIFPALEIMIIYYLTSLKLIRIEFIFVMTIFLDQFYGFPLGMSAFTFIIANLLLKFANKWLILLDYSTNCAAFSGYATIIFFMRSITYAILNHQFNTTELVFQTLITVFCYPSFHLLLNKLVTSSGQLN